MERIARARADLGIGVPVVVTGGGGAALVAAAETVSPARLHEMQAMGQAVLAVTGRRAATLKARAYDGDLARIVLPAGAGPAWVRAVADPAHDLAAPMKGPLATERGGEALLHRAGIALCKAARLLPAAVVLPLEGPAPEGLTVVTAAAVLDAAPIAMTEVVAARVPLSVSEAGRLHVFRPADGAEEHYAVEIGQPPRDRPVLVRLHSACFTGDLLGSLKCDCGAQLRAALAQMGAEGAGVLLYLNQEGRGIGLANKMRA
jgi:GTP cyclohydrolase II